MFLACIQFVNAVKNNEGVINFERTKRWIPATGAMLAGIGNCSVKINCFLTTAFEFSFYFRIYLGHCFNMHANCLIEHRKSRTVRVITTTGNTPAYQHWFYKNRNGWVDWAENACKSNISVFNNTNCLYEELHIWDLSEVNLIYLIYAQVSVTTRNETIRKLRIM